MKKLKESEFIPYWNAVYDDLIKNAKHPWEAFGYDEKSFIKRIKRVNSVISNNLANKKFDKVLDIGCNNGYFFSKIDLNYNISIGCDIHYNSLHQSSENKTHQYSFLTNGERLPFSNNSFDLVTMFESLSTSKNHALILNEATKVLNNNGILIIDTRLKISIINTFLRYLYYFFFRKVNLKLKFMILKSRILKRNLKYYHDKQNLISLKELLLLIKQNDLFLIKYEPKKKHRIFSPERIVLFAKK